MSNIPENLRYTEDHEWARDEGDGIVAVGITDYAQDALGDITYLEVPEPGDTVTQGEGFGTIESVKTFSDLIAPVSGEVVEVNSAALDEPESINSEPYGVWLIKIRAENVSDLGGLLDAAAYKALIESAG